MSNVNIGEKPIHRKSKVSCPTLIETGLVDPKMRLKSVVDGYQVNIPKLYYIFFFDGMTKEVMLIIIGINN